MVNKHGFNLEKSASCKAMEGPAGDLMTGHTSEPPTAVLSWCVQVVWNNVEPQTGSQPGLVKEKEKTTSYILIVNFNRANSPLKMSKHKKMYNNRE